MAVGAGGLTPAGDATELGISVGREVLAQDHVIGDDQAIDARCVGRARLIEQWPPAADAGVHRGEVPGLERERGRQGLERAGTGHDRAPRVHGTPETGEARVGAPGAASACLPAKKDSSY